jgi:hypothetical protein
MFILYSIEEVTMRESTTHEYYAMAQATVTALFL